MGGALLAIDSELCFNGLDLDMEAVIEVKHLVKRFNSVAAVADVSFEIRAGEIFGFLGPNGAGKTTTINILCTLLRPTSGQALVCGYDVVKEQSRVRQCIGLVFQEPSLDERMTAYDNLEFHAFVYNMPRAKIGQRIKEALQMVGLWERKDSVVRTFSGGMKRRLELARGLLHRPRVLFLDEPTLGLDPQSRAQMWEYIRKLQEEENITIFLTTHYMDEAENANRIAIIDRGQIVALDTPEVLKEMVGGDVIRLVTEDDERAQQELGLYFNIDAERDGHGLQLEVSEGSQLIPRLTRSLSTPIHSITIRRPTLDDVFLKLTGKGLRDVEASPVNSWREHGRRQRSGSRG